MKREYINESIQLCSYGDSGKFTRTFKIIGCTPDEGASAVCYEAYYEGSGRGVLKEFYPQYISYKPRCDENQQLVCSDEFKADIKEFRKKCDAYIEPYIQLQKMKRDEKYHELATFIPPFEIYYGLSDNSTVYIWTPLPKLLTFEAFCSSIHEHPQQGAGYKFIQVIDAVRYLARCVCELQTGQLVNRDIKPSNLGFFKRGDEIQPQTLSMFDLDSLCFVGSTSGDNVYSQGYTEPEINNPGYQPNYQTDIYSIGAVLFHALIVNDEMKAGHFLYRDEYFSRLEEFVSTSELIKSADVDYNNIKLKLAEILRSCLCGRDRRYRDPQTGIPLGCEKLIEDLDNLFSDYTRGRTLYDERKNYLTDLETNYTLVLQYHLYKYPLYRSALNEDSINVMLLGFGQYSDKFLDVCLQAGQMVGKVLNVCVILGSVVDKEEYLRNRPALSEFFNIDGSLANKPDNGYDPYGNITFIEKPEIARIFSEIPDIQTINEILGSQANTSFMLIDLNNDEQNVTAAKLCAQALGERCCINFVCRNKTDSDKLEDIIPVYVNADVSQLPEFQDIERMAFNAHLSWLPDMNVDQEEVRKQFRNPYNHMASIANVMTIKYKLASINPEYDGLTLDEAAKKFDEFLKSNTPEDRRKYNELICLEHRRWTTERLCDGCTKKLPQECDSDGDTRDRKTTGRRKVTRHVCVVRSRADQLLHNEWDNDMQKWNSPSVDELAQLDELDRMSVELHRVFLEKARERMRQNILDESILSRICGLIEKEPAALSAFQDLVICMRDIITGINEVRVDSARRKVSYYSKLSETFKKFLHSEKISQENREEATREIKTLENNFRPILDSMRFRDYKHSDTDLIDSIPFILTYSDNITMVIPYFDDVHDRTKFFGNAASVITINPSRIIYLSYIEDDDDANKLVKSIKQAGAYITGRNLRARVEFMIIRNPYVILLDSMANEIKRAFVNAEVKFYDAWSVYEAAEIFSEQLASERDKAGGNAVFAVEKNNSHLSGVLEGNGLYSSFAHYKFASDTMSFSNISGCELFGYINKTHSVMRADMFAINKGLAPEFFRDYGILWAEYRRNRTVWKMLCDGLRDHEKEKSRIAEFPLKRETHKKPQAEIRRYILPSICREAVELIFEALKKNAVIEDVSRIRNYTTNSFELVIYDRCGYGGKYDELFGNPYRLISSDAIDVNDDDARNVDVMFNSLIAQNISVPGFGTDRYDNVITLMKFFHGIGFVSKLRIDRGTMNFTYGTREIKQLMTKSGRILEIYTYHKIRELGYFDDVISSLEVKWGETLNIRNEFDCILTKGFRTLFIECKARNVLEQGMFNQIASLTEQLGINSIPVLIADTGDIEEGRVAKINHDMRERGRELGVITIWRINEIENIGTTMMNIMNGTYKPQY